MCQQIGPGRYNFGYFDPSGQAGALRRLRDLYKNIRIVLLSFYGDVTVVRESLALGVSGYVLKWASDLVSAIEEVMVGRIYVSPALRYSG
jgi:two-component system, NarL family, response regulator DegU